MGGFDQVYDDPYDPSVTDQQTQTPPLDVTIWNAVQRALLMMFKVRPAVVTKVKGNQKADIQIELQQRYTDGTLMTLGTCQDAVVWMPMGQDYGDRLPFAVGDEGIAIFCDRSLDAWKVQGGTVDPNDTRVHDISDAIFIPGLTPASKQTQDQTTDRTITNGSGQIRVQKSGKILLGGKSAASPVVMGDVLVSLMDALITQIENAVTAINNLNEAFTTGAATFITVTGSPGGPSPLSPTLVTALGTATSALSTVSTQLTSLKQQYVDTADTNFNSQTAFTERKPG